MSIWYLFLSDKFLTHVSDGVVVKSRMPPERVRGDLRGEGERALGLTSALARPLAPVLALVGVVVVAAALAEEGGHHVGGLGARLGRPRGLGLDKVGDARAKAGVVGVLCKEF